MRWQNLSEILSQNEIDSLLDALTTGEVDVSDIKDESKEKKIKKYDFKSPKKLAKDQLRTLHMMHENFARVLNTFFSGYLRTFVQIDVLSVEELSYYEFSNSISNPAMLSIINFMPLPGDIIFDISTRLCYSMIDRILGGDGKYDGEIRAFTEIEITILKKIVSQVANLFIDPWENVIELSPVLDKIETNSQFAQIVSPNETVALITLKVKVGDAEGLMNICIPHIVLEPILTKLSTKFWFSTNVTKKISEEDKINLKNRVKKANLDLSCVIGETNITVEEFLMLQRGDVVTLNSTIENDFEIRVNNKNKFYGKPGSIKNNLAVKITKVIEEGDLEYDE